MRIRRATRGDRPAIARVHATSWQHAYRGLFSDDFLDNEASGDLGRRWETAEIGPDDVVLVADDGGVVGFIAVWCRPDPFIDNLHVLPPWQSKGVGRKLMVAAANQLIQQGKSTVYLWVLADNRRALDFYERLGGVRMECTEKEVFGHRLSSVRILWPDLSVMVD